MNLSQFRQNTSWRTGSRQHVGFPVEIALEPLVIARGIRRIDHRPRARLSRPITSDDEMRADPLIGKHYPIHCDFMPYALGLNRVGENYRVWRA